MNPIQFIELFPILSLLSVQSNFPVYIMFTSRQKLLKTRQLPQYLPLNRVRVFIVEMQLLHIILLKHINQSMTMSLLYIIAFLRKATKKINFITNLRLSQQIHGLLFFEQSLSGVPLLLLEFVPKGLR